MNNVNAAEGNVKEFGDFRLNPPNPRKLIKALRHLDYDNKTAIADIVDNSIDAGAGRITVGVFPEKSKKDKEGSEVAKIIISDNGSGMDIETLDEAMRLGSDVDKNASCDLGLYGMGLITASISLGTRLTVITKTLGGGYLTSIQDLSIIEEKNEFLKELRESTMDEMSIFKEFVIPSDDKSTDISGTIVIIEGIDNCKWKSVRGLTENLIPHLGQVYRKFIQAGKIKIMVKGQEVTALDPIGDYEPTILLKDRIPVDGEVIDLTIAEIRDYGQAINREKGFNIPNQGFYVLRNQREILSGKDLGIFTKHNSLNLLRIEFSYPGTLDEILSSNFSKNRIELHQSLKNKVEQICNPYIKQAKRLYKARSQSQKTRPEEFSEVEKHITRKSHLLKTPKVEIEERKAKTEGSQDKKRIVEPGSPRLNLVKRHRVSLEALKVKFELRNLGEFGPIYDLDQEKDKVIIYWNADHVFYHEFISPNTENPDILYPICFLVYCLASAELRSRPNSDSETIIAQFKYDVGQNMAVLMR